MSAGARPIRVAVVGGGCASLAAAFALTRPELEGRYRVTVYQQGWRLGGKGASGRGAAGRIEEHGLHLWMGWYENAFRLMRDCYAELGRDARSCPMASWTDAFEPYPRVGVMDRTGDGGWRPWTAVLPPSEGLPGDPGARRFTLASYMRRSAALVRTLLETLSGTATEAGSAPDADEVARLARRLTLYGELATLATLTQAVAALESVVGSLSRYPDVLVLRFLDAIAVAGREQIESLVADDPEARRLWTIADLTLASMRGIVRFGLLSDPRGLDAIDEYDCREWLLLNGASHSSVDSGFLRGLYDLVFAYEDGDPSRPRMAAGQALRGMIRAFFGYRGSFFWRMNAGMGDVVFAPLYEVLRRRGVGFEFFHRLENVKLDGPDLGLGESPHVEALEFDVQTRTQGDLPYQPLVNVRGLPCWPSAPRWEQLVAGEAFARSGRDFESFWDRGRVGTLTLQVERDFDFVVLGVGIGAIPHVCREIVSRDARWRAMVDHVKTVATQAFQIWLRHDVKELGWLGPAASVSGFVEPFDTWADMRHLLSEEGWERAPGGLAYFCNALPDVADGDQATGPRRREAVRHNAIRFLDEHIGYLWPGALRAPGAFRWDLLVDPDSPDDADPAADESRFDTQFWTANVNPSDRYTLSLPGSSAYRISPLDRSYDNLTVAGDWTACGFNAGCVEAAVMSGLLAAHALSLSPPLEQIVGFDHP